MQKKMYDRSTFIAGMIGLAMLYAMMSADCATDPRSVGCYFANGDLANWIFAMPKTLWETFEVFIFG